MKRTSAALKLTARENLNGQYGIPLSALLLLGLCTLIPSMIITSVANTSTITGIITSQLLVYIVSLIVSVIGAGYSKLMLNLNRKEPFSLADLFYAFSHHPDRFIVVHLILLFIQFIIGLPFTIPLNMNSDLSGSTILLLSYASLLLDLVISTLLCIFFGLCDYLLLDYPEMGAIQSMKESLRLMKGNKGRFLHLVLSFLPLGLLCVFTCYIGALWVGPYYRSTLTLFYLDVTGELDASKQENPSYYENNLQDTYSQE